MSRALPWTLGLGPSLRTLRLAGQLRRRALQPSAVLAGPEGERTPRVWHFARWSQLDQAQHPCRIVLDFDHVRPSQIDGLEQALVRLAPEQLLLLGSGGEPAMARRLLGAGAHWLDGRQGEEEILSRLIAALPARLDVASTAGAAPGDAARGDAARGDEARGDEARGDAAPGDARPREEAPRAADGSGRVFERAWQIELDTAWHDLERELERAADSDPAGLEPSLRALHAFERKTGVYGHGSPAGAPLELAALALDQLLDQRLQRLRWHGPSAGRLFAKLERVPPIAGHGRALACALECLILAGWHAAGPQACLRVVLATSRSGVATLELDFGANPALDDQGRFDPWSERQDQVNALELHAALDVLSQHGCRWRVVGPKDSQRLELSFPTLPD